MSLDKQNIEALHTQDRFHSLDAVRACALLAGIVLHAIMSFLPGFREVNWPLADESTSVGLGILFFVIHLFRMSLFFIIAGFFARLLHQRLGTNDFIKNRLRRIGLPLIAFYFLVMPLTIIAIIWGARQIGMQGPPKMELPIPVIGPPIPLGHLWFLYLLLLLYALVLVARAIVVRMDTNNNLRDAIGRLLLYTLKTRTAILLLAVPLAAALFYAPWWFQWQGIPAPIMGLIPNFPALLAYGSAFIVGWFLHQQQTSLRILANDGWLYFAGALVATGVSLYIVGVIPEFSVMKLGNSERAIYSLTYTIALWCWAFSAIGIAVRYLEAVNAQWRYLADASYWMYLIHLPIIWLLQAWMLRWPLYWPIKLSLILGITGVLLFTSYHYLVRPTFLGKFLNGRKYPHQQKEITATL